MKNVQLLEIYVKKYKHVINLFDKKGGGWQKVGPRQIK